MLSSLRLDNQCINVNTIFIALYLYVDTGLTLNMQMYLQDIISNNILIGDYLLTDG